ncbi:Vps54-domain-containing protein [Dendrothele bispora CBS 962.96]|uniref:Vps54-domain-containing protein n=1 Tax=Dendrothele bispora (strain CBS 962.96) TaxID=1314807 RepID=A0A4S8LA19_DENBC|nr:Vps54-domain-containing protein [Dendrothele bispora CBS 962.96]
MSELDSNPTASRPGSPISALPNQTQYRFNWETKGPESVSGTTTGPNDYFANAPPRLAHLFGGSTASLTLSALPSEWSSTSDGFHAISTVLNNPHRKQAPPKAHSALPAVPPTDLPRVRRKDFDSYLRAIASDWEKLQQPASSFSSSKSSDAELEIPPPPLAPLDQVPRVFFNPDFDLTDPKTFGEVTEADQADASDPTALAHALPLLEKFSHYADTIEMHLAHEIALRSHSFFAALTNLNLLQSESTQCLSQISRLRGMLEEVDTGVARRGLEIVKLEKKLSNLRAVEGNVEGVKGVVGITSQGRGHVSGKSYNEALGVVQKLETMWEPPSIPGPSQVNDKSIPEEDETEESPIIHRLSVPLSSLHAFSALPDHLRSLTMEITTALSDDLVEVLREDLSRRIEQGNKTQNSQKLKDRLAPLLEGLLQTRGLKEATLSWREVVLGETRGIIRKQYPEFEMDEDGARTPNEVDKPGLGAHLRSLSHPEFMKSLRSIYQSYLNAAEGLQAQTTIVGEVVESIEKLKMVSSVSPSTPKPPNPSSTSASSLNIVHAELQDTLTSSVELAHVLLSSLLSSRSPSHVSLPLPSFVEVFQTTWDFVISSEVICKKMIVALRGGVVTQARMWLKTFHESKMGESAKGVEEEVWNHHEVNRGPWTNDNTEMEVQRAVNVIVASAMGDPVELGTAWLQKVKEKKEGADGSDSSSTQTQTNGKGSIGVPLPSPSAPRSKSSSSTKSKHLMVEGQPFFTVHATSSALLLLLDYLRIPVCLGLLTTDAMQRVIEFLKAFNSRTCQVVLGAGAMRSAGLKNITAKHLALASQSLSIMIALIPYVREAFRRHLNPKQAVMLVEFDKLKRDYQEHQHEIHAKLIAIMSDLLNKHIKSLQAPDFPHFAFNFSSTPKWEFSRLHDIYVHLQNYRPDAPNYAVDWDVPKPDGGVNSYMELLVKETETLHKVLSRYLSTTVVEEVMSQVFAAINHRLSEAYGKVELPHNEAKMRLLADAKYLHQKLSALKGVGPNSMLETVVSEKSVARPSAPPTPSRNSTMISPPSSAASNTSTNQRLKGLLSGRSLTLDKMLPTPLSTKSATPPLPPSSASVQRSASSLSGAKANGSPTATTTNGSQRTSNSTDDASGSSVTQKSNGNASPLPPLPVDKDERPSLSRSASSGFRQVEMSPVSETSEAKSYQTRAPEKGPEPALGESKSSVTDRKKTVMDSNASDSQSQYNGPELAQPTHPAPAQSEIESGAVIDSTLTESPPTPTADLPQHPQPSVSGMEVPAVKEPMPAVSANNSRDPPSLTSEGTSPSHEPSLNIPSTVPVDDS